MGSKKGVTAKSFFLARQLGRWLTDGAAKHGMPFSWLRGSWSGDRGESCVRSQREMRLAHLLALTFESLSFSSAPGLRYLFGEEEKEDLRGDAAAAFRFRFSFIVMMMMMVNHDG